MSTTSVSKFELASFLVFAHFQATYGSACIGIVMSSSGTQPDFLREIKIWFSFSGNMTSASGVLFLIFADSVQTKKHVFDIPLLRLYYKVYHS